MLQISDIVILEKEASER